MGEIPIAPDVLCEDELKKTSTAFHQWMVAVRDTIKKRFGDEIAIPTRVGDEFFYTWIGWVYLFTGAYPPIETVENNCIATEPFKIWMVNVKKHLEG